MLKRQLFEKFMCLMIWLLTAEWIVVVFFWKRERERENVYTSVYSYFVHTVLVHSLSNKPLNGCTSLSLLHEHNNPMQMNNRRKVAHLSVLPEASSNSCGWNSTVLTAPLWSFRSLSSLPAVKSHICCKETAYIKPYNLSHTLNTLAMSVAMALQMHRIPVSKLASRSPP